VDLAAEKKQNLLVTHLLKMNSNIRGPVLELNRTTGRPVTGGGWEKERCFGGRSHCSVEADWWVTDALEKKGNALLKQTKEKGGCSPLSNGGI